MFLTGFPTGVPTLPSYPACKDVRGIIFSQSILYSVISFFNPLPLFCLKES